MRMMLKALVLVLSVVGTTMFAMEAAEAVEKVKGRAELQNSKGVQVAQKGNVAPVAKKGTATPIASNATLSKGGRVKSEQAKGIPVAEKGKAKPVTANGKAVPLATKENAVARSAQPKPTALARKGRSIPAPARSSLTHAAQKRNLTRDLASNVDIWQEPGKLAVQSGSALVIGGEGGELFYEKNANVVVPIASITKVMTAMVVLDSLPNLQAPITISDEDVDYLRGSRSRLGVGAEITRETALLLALMSSENRAANALGRHYPGGLQAFVAAMNRKALSLGMKDTRFEDPTGLNSNNVSTAHDLARMVAAAHRYPLIREFSTTPGARVEVKGRDLDFHNTNQLVSSPTWAIGLSKTGYIREAGKCLVMQAQVADKPVVIVLLDSAGKQTRIGDANRIKRWMESASATGRLLARG
jgi:D-alanyl-D-alanine endopeptidase (penicillin-binding protein 7)